MRKLSKKLKKQFRLFKTAVLEGLKSFRLTFKIKYRPITNVKLPEGWLRCTSDPVHKEWAESDMTLGDFRRYYIEKRVKEIEDKTEERWQDLKEIYPNNPRFDCVKDDTRAEEKAINKLLTDGKLNFNLQTATGRSGQLGKPIDNGKISE